MLTEEKLDEISARCQHYPQTSLRSDFAFFFYAIHVQHRLSFTCLAQEARIPVLKFNLFKKKLCVNINFLWRCQEYVHTKDHCSIFYNMGKFYLYLLSHRLLSSASSPSLCRLSRQVEYHTLLPEQLNSFWEALQ